MVAKAAGYVVLLASITFRVWDAGLLLETAVCYSVSVI